LLETIIDKGLATAIKTIDQTFPTIIGIMIGTKHR